MGNEMQTEHIGLCKKLNASCHGINCISQKYVLKSKYF
jgi:hypothetical protein